MDVFMKKMDFSMLKKLNLAHRKEGFAGQHLVVLPKAVVQTHSHDPLLSGLRVTDAGFFPKAHGHYIEREKGAPTTLVIVCLAGEGWVKWGDGVRRQIRARDIAWLPPNQRHAYGADRVKPWSIVWVCFEGDETNAWKKYLDMPPHGGMRSLTPQISLAVIRHLEEIHPVLEQGYTRSQLVLAASLLRRALSQAGSTVSESQVTATHARVAATFDWMRTHPERPVRLEELAAMAGVSVPHYTAVFRELTGYSPINYHARLRIQRACRMLDTTSARIGEIAGSLGFDDPYYFSRIFRRIMGCPPREYRSIKKG